MEEQNYSTGQGQGLAQVLGSSDYLNVRNQQEIGRRRREDQMAEQQKARQAQMKAKNEKAIKDGIRKMKANSLKLDTKGMHYHDVKPFSDEIQGFLKQYEGQWEDMYRNPEKMADFDAGMQEFRLKIEESRAKKIWGENFLKEYNKNPGSYSEKTKEKFRKIYEGYGEEISPLFAVENIDINEWEREEVLPFEKDLFDSSQKASAYANIESNQKGSRLSKQISLEDAKLLWVNKLANDDEVATAIEESDSWIAAAEAAGEDNVLKYYIETKAKQTHNKKWEKATAGVISSRGAGEKDPSNFEGVKPAQKTTMLNNGGSITSDHLGVPEEQLSIENTTGIIYPEDGGFTGSEEDGVGVKVFVSNSLALPKDINFKERKPGIFKGRAKKAETFRKKPKPGVVYIMAEEVSFSKDNPTEEIGRRSVMIPADLPYDPKNIYSNGAKALLENRRLEQATRNKAITNNKRTKNNTSFLQEGNAK